jgi:hypothetical protein
MVLNNLGKPQKYAVFTLPCHVERPSVNTCCLVSLRCSILNEVETSVSVTDVSTSFAVIKLPYSSTPKVELGPFNMTSGVKSRFIIGII